MTLTVHGQRIGPLRITGPHLDHTLAHYAQPHNVPALEHTARTTAGAAPLHQLTTGAGEYQARVIAFLAQRAPTTTTHGRHATRTEGYQ
jgi:hypothetical protein